MVGRCWLLKLALLQLLMPRTWAGLPFHRFVTKLLKYVAGCVCYMNVG